MTLKTKMSLLVFLTSLSIVSIGFSSWSITAETTAEINGNIEVDNVIESLSYIDMKSAPSFLVYSKDGFVNSNGEYIRTVGFNAEFEINIKNCKNYFLDLSSIIVDVTLSHNELCDFETGKGFFDTYSLTYGTSGIKTNFSFSSDISLDGKELSLSSNELIINKNKFSINFALSDYYTISDSSPDKIILSIDYSWTLDDTNNYFEEVIYPIIYNESSSSNIIDFSLGVSLTGN